MILLVLLMRILSSTIFPVGRATATIAQPIFFTAVRMTLAGTILLGFYFWRFKRLSPGIRQAIGPLIVFIITGIYITNAAEFWALQFVPAAKASFLYSLSPFAAALFSYLIFQEKMTLKKLCGMGISMVGFLLILLHEAPGEVDYRGIGFISWGEMALIIAAVSTAYGWIVMRRKMLKGLVTPIEAIGLSMLGGGLLMFVNSFLAENWNPVPLKVPWNIPSFGINLSIAVVCSSILGYVLYTSLLRTYTATFLSFSGFIEPLSAAFLSWLFLGELITWRFVISAILVFIGLSIFYREELRQGYIIKR